MNVVGFAPRPSAAQAKVRFGIFYPVVHSLKEPKIPLLDASERVAAFAALPANIPADQIIRVADADKKRIVIAVGNSPLCAVVTSPGGDLQIGELQALRKRVLSEQHLILQAAADYPVIARELAKFCKDRGLMLRVDAATASAAPAR